MFDDLREKIDQIDKQIMALIKERFAVVDQIGEIKKEEGIPVFDPEREKLIKDRLAEIADEQGLSKDFVLGLYERIFEESRRLQG